MSDDGLNPSRPVSAEGAFDPQPVVRQLQAEGVLPPGDDVELRQYAGGASNLTFELRVGAAAVILRRPPPGAKPESGHDMDREFRVLTALQGRFPCPQPLFRSSREDLVGAPFFVMQKLDGLILRRDLPAGMSLDTNAAAVLAHTVFDLQRQLHELDFAAAGLSDLGRPEGYVGRQVGGWSKRYRRAITDDVPDNEALMTWLAREQPADSPRPGLIHNDYRLDNLVLDSSNPQQVVGVLDWEMCTVGDPLLDLGCSLAYWIEAADPPAMQALRMQPSHLPGMPTRAELVRRYTEASGRDTGDFRWYYVFGLFRLAAIVQQIYYRYRLGQTRNPRFAGFGQMNRVLSATALRAIDAGIDAA